MKPRNIAIALAFCVPLVSTYAQPIRQGNEQRLEAVAKQLRLTPMQERRMVPILRTEALKVQGIKNNQSLSQSQKLRRLRAAQNRSNRKLRVILNARNFGYCKRTVSSRSRSSCRPQRAARIGAQRRDRQRLLLWGRSNTRAEGTKDPEKNC